MQLLYYYYIEVAQYLVSRIWWTESVPARRVRVCGLLCLHACLKTNLRIFRNLLFRHTQINEMNNEINVKN